MLLLLLLLLTFVIICLYWYLSSNYTYWKKRSVPNPPISILFGNLGPSLSLTRSIGQIYSDIYHTYPNLLYVGFYKIRQPGIVLRHPELIKDVLIKEFNSFHDNDFSFDEKVDPIAAKNPFALKGKMWKVVRNQLTPCFTSRKIKAMYPLIADAAKKLTAFLDKDLDAKGSSGIDAKELCAKYTTEVIAKCAFGLEGKCFDEPEPEFRKMGKKIFAPDMVTSIKHILLFAMPSLANILKVKFFTNEVVAYFRNNLSAILKYRDEKKIIRNDFLDFIKELKNKPGQYTFTDEDILAHSLGFFTDGFETSSAALCYAFFELANNPNIQKKLLDEIEVAIENNKGNLDFDLISELKYLDLVLNESLRMHPPGMALLKVCTEAFTLPSPLGKGTGSDVKIEVGTPVVIPVYGLHYDSKYFPDPEEFNPDRFSNINSKERPKCVFLPFGDGPRACLGQQFGIIQMKVAVVNVVVNYEIKVNNKTIVPLEIDPVYAIPHAKGGIWLNFEKREGNRVESNY